MKRIMSIILALALLLSAAAIPAAAMTQQEMLDRVRQMVGSPTPAPTATPAPGPEQEPEEPADPEEEPGAEAADDDEAQAGADFRQGYIEVRRGLKAWRSASSKAQPAGTFTEKGYAFALRVNDEWLETAFVDAAHKAVTVVYVKAADVKPASETVAQALQMTLKRAPRYEGYPLPFVKFSAETAAEESAEPAAEEAEVTEAEEPAAGSSETGPETAEGPSDPEAAEGVEATGAEEAAGAAEEPPAGSSEAEAGLSEAEEPSGEAVTAEDQPEAEPGQPEDTPDSPREDAAAQPLTVTISVTSEGPLEPGAMITLHAQVSDDDYQGEILWQYSADGGQTVCDVEDAEGTEYSFLLDEENRTYWWRAYLK